MTITVPIQAIGKPRMTRKDRWAKRLCVVKYYQWADDFRSLVGDIPNDPTIINFKAYIPFPKSYSKKKRRELEGKPHRVKPDLDNCLKSIMDVLLKNDQGIYKSTCEKVWTDGEPKIILEII